MVTDPAPTDLVLQRLGRLHRHPRGEARPRALRTATLWLLRPEVGLDGVPQFDPGTSAVYDRHVLLRSWLALRDRARIEVPDDVANLIASVYDERELLEAASVELGREWAKTLESYRAKLFEEQTEAAYRWLKPPTYGGDVAGLVGEAREEDAPDFHPAFQALTRLPEPSVPAVVLAADELPGVEDGRGSKAPPLEVVRELLRRSVTLSDRRIVFPLMKEQAPASWRRSALLRNHRLMRLDAEGAREVAGHRVRLDPSLGVVVDELGEE
jgi:CRISPR-associated endonuclease/helicase Cas3